MSNTFPSDYAVRSTAQLRLRCVRKYSSGIIHNTEAHARTTIRVSVRFLLAFNLTFRLFYLSRGAFEELMTSCGHLKT